MNTSSNDFQAKPNGNGALIQEERSFSIVDLLENFIYFRWHFVVTLQTH